MLNKDCLFPIQADKRDFSLGSIFPLTETIELPESYIIPDLEIKNQFDTDYCSAFATILASEIDEKVKLSEVYQFAKTKQVMGDFETWGADLRSACKAIVKYGSLEDKDCPYTIDDDRNTVANWLNYPLTLEDKAIEHKKKSFFNVDGFLSVYDSIKTAIYKHERVVITGARWRATWTNNKIIPDTYEDSGFGHAFVWKGWTVINGEEYLVAHLSNGTTIGDKGCFYFPRDIVEKEAVYGNYILIDMDKETAEWMHTNKITINDNWLIQMFKIISNFIKTLWR